MKENKEVTNSLQMKTDFIEKEVIESQPEIESDIEMGNESLLKRFGSQEKVDEFINNGFIRIMKRLEDSGHLPKD